jgi:crotonobetainyl-CoA:carnitine CoA-transferase CaiB-like acyl-CoA transferase
VSSPLKLSGTPVRRDLPPPLLGQHTDEVLRDVLHLSATDIDQLRQNKII